MSLKICLFEELYVKVIQTIYFVTRYSDLAEQIVKDPYCFDDKLRQPGENPTIGLILCKGKDNLIVEYALRNNSSPISVANFETQIAKALPENLKGTLPSVEEIEAELERSVRENYRANSNDDGLSKRTFQEEFGERYSSSHATFRFL
jgi:hypothetical protein